MTDELLVGVATADITPPVGAVLAGYKPRASEGVAHRLRAEAMVVRGGGPAGAMVTSDTLGYRGDFVAEVRGRIYLNFGDDWRRDFTVRIAPRDKRAFARAGLDLLALEGRTIRVRGWIKWRDGPMIDATHPEQIELVTP